MAILLLESFDRYASISGTSPNIGEAWTPTSSSTQSAIVTGRFGVGKAMRIGNPTATWNLIRSIGGSYAAMAIGFAYKCSEVPSDLGLVAGGTPIFNFNDSANAVQLQLCADASGNVIAKRGTATTIGTGNGNRKIVSQAFHFIECEIVVSDTVGVFKVWIDDVLVINLTGIDTAQTANINIGSISIPMIGSQEGQYEFDDLYVTDGTRLGDHTIVSLSPTADTADKDWVPNSGVTNYTQVDDVVSDLETTYLQATTVGDLDFYNLADLPAGLDVIKAVAPVLYSRKTDAGTRVTRAVIKSNTDILNGPNKSETASYVVQQFIQETDPQGGGAWTAARVNAVQLGIEVVT